LVHWAPKFRIDHVTMTTSFSKRFVIPRLTFAIANEYTKFEVETGKAKSSLWAGKGDSTSFEAMRSSESSIVTTLIPCTISEM